MQDKEKTVIQTLYVFMIVTLVGTALVLASSLNELGRGFAFCALSILSGVITCLIVLWLFHNKQFYILHLVLPATVKG